MVQVKYFFLERPNSVTAKIYQENCIKTRLNDFINKNYPDRSNIIFWPDLASSHYAKTTLALLASLNIPFVKRADNPPNLPQCRPIEKFWSKLKSEVYKNGWEAESIRQLKQRIKFIFSKIDMSTVRCDFESLLTNLALVAKRGPLTTIKS